MRIQNELINKSIEYILQHINEEMSVEDVAKHCNFSKYYFSRMFKSETGMSIYAFIKSIKIDQSAVSLKIERDKTITNIGEDYGYSASNYSSAFSKEHDVCPLEFRKSVDAASSINPFFENENADFKTFEYYDKNISIQNICDMNVIYERYIGSYIEIGENWYNFMERYKDYIKEDTLLIEKSYNDPSISKPEKCVYDLCITAEKEVKCENIKIIKGGKFAVYRFDGFIHDIFADFQGIFTVWLPRCKCERDDRYGLGIYRNIDKESNRVVMDLCIPIK